MPERTDAGARCPSVGSLGTEAISNSKVQDAARAAGLAGYRKPHPAPAGPRAARVGSAGLSGPCGRRFCPHSNAPARQRARGSVACGSSWSAATVPCQVRADLSAPFLRSMTGRRTSQPCHVHDALCRAARLRQRQHPVDVDERDGTSADRGGGTPGPCRAACSRLCPTRRLRVVYSPPRHAGRTACAGAASEKSLARAHCPCASVPTGVVSHLRPPPSPAARVYKCPSRAAPDPLVPPPIRSAHHPAHAGHALRLACAACPRRTCSRYRGAPARSPRRGRGAPPAAAGPWNARPALRALASGTAGTADGRLPA